MKKGAFLVLGALCALPAAAAPSFDWQIPVTTLRVETAAGTEEDPEEETLLPSSVRNTVSIRIREEADPALFGLTLRGSWKDYFLQAGDYWYLEAEQDSSFRISNAVKLGYTAAVKDAHWPELDSQGLPKDFLALKAGVSAVLTIVRGTTLDTGVNGRWEIAANDASALQVYTLSAALSSRIGEWVFGARYRGEFRLPLGSESGVTSTSYHTAALSLEWDPNR